MKHRVSVLTIGHNVATSAKVDGVIEHAGVAGATIVKSAADSRTEP